MQKESELISEGLAFKYFREFTKNTAFLFFPLIAEIVVDGMMKIFSPIHLFLLLGLLLQTYLLVRIEKKKFYQVFLLNISIPFLYLGIEFIDEGYFLGNTVYVLYFIYSIINALFNALMYTENFRLNKIFSPLDICVKLLLIPIFYYVLDFRVGDTSSGFFTFYLFESNIHTFLFLVFIFLGVIFGIDAYLTVTRKHLLQSLLSILHKYSSWIVDEQDLKKSIAAGKVDISSKKVYKAVVFMDIRGFTSWSESHEAEQVTQMLNGFYTVAEELIGRYTGSINKYVADEIVFVFDALEDAVDYSLALKQKENEYLSPFGLTIGFGINAGILVYGWIGTESKKEQTVIGDVVNVAARLEGGVNQIRIPEVIVPEGYKTQEIGDLELKGKSQKIHIVEIIGKK